MAKALRTLSLGLLGLAALLQAGCLAAAVGTAVGASAAAGYVYFNGLLYRDYHANLGDTLSAVRTSLMELEFPVIKEKTDTGTAYFQTQTGDGHSVRIYLDVVPSAIPAEGVNTRVSIRVGFSGDEGVSARILDQIGRHLVPVGQPVGSGVAPPPGALSSVTPKETSAPPVAAAVPPVAPGERLTPIPASPPPPLVPVAASVAPVATSAPKR
ncbi:MAG: DUF3568 family protein [Gemmataceae bacterium]